MRWIDRTGGMDVMGLAMTSVLLGIGVAVALVLMDLLKGCY